jgi:hypothetical protein
MRSSLALSVLALVSTTFSQEQYYIDPDSVSLGLRGAYNPTSIIMLNSDNG